MARLVRCPKCQKLLVEYPNVSVYQCGGCAISLRSKSLRSCHSDRGFSDSESISGPLTSSNKEQQVDSVKLTDAGLRDVVKSPATGSSLAYYDGSVSSSDEAPSVRALGKSRRTVRAASSSDLKLRSGSVRSFDSDEFQSVADLPALPQGSFIGEMNEKAAILRKIGVPRQRQASRGSIHRWQRKQMRHCRPVSGAAPFVICAHCNKLLQLPAENFLAPRRRSYKLKCAGCDAVLDLAFPAKVQSFTEVDPAPTEPDDEPDSGSDLLHGDDENGRGYAKMESTGKRGSSSMYQQV